MTTLEWYKRWFEDYVLSEKTYPFVDNHIQGFLADTKVDWREVKDCKTFEEAWDIFIRRQDLETVLRWKLYEST